MKNNLFGKSLVTVELLTKNDVDLVFNRANEMEKLVKLKGGDDRLKNKIMAALFFEPSSRTFSSFITSMQRLGGGFIPLNNMQATSAVKGETFEDTIKVFSSYANVLVIRHPEAGFPAKATKYTNVPVINAGDGAFGEHPSQGLLDLYTINKFFKGLKRITIVMVGDLAHYRGVKSLSKLLCLFSAVKVKFVSPRALRITDDLRDYLKAKSLNFSEHEDLQEVINEADVLNVTRLKKEYLDEDLYNKLQGSYLIDLNTIKKMKKNSIIIHNLPKIWEITREVDDDPRAIYLTKQVRNGMYVRMAILDLILNS